MLITKHLRSTRKTKTEQSSYVMLELTPPAFKHKTSLVSEELFRVLYDILPIKYFGNRRQAKSSLSLEIVSSKNYGIRFLLRVLASDAELIKQAINAYMPDVYVRQVNDYLLAIKSGVNRNILSYRLARHFSRPLNDHSSLAAQDPVAYLISAMSGLDKDELISLQMVLAPYRIKRQLSVRAYSAKPRVSRSLKPILDFLVNSFESTLTILGDTMAGSYMKRKPIQAEIRTHISPTDRQNSNATENKLNQPLFLFNLRVLAISPECETGEKRIRSLNSAVSSYSSNGSQALNLERRKSRTTSFVEFKARKLSSRKTKNRLLSPSEIAAIYHFPIANSRPSENLIVSRSRILAPSQSIMRSNEFDVLIGKNTHGDKIIPIGLTLEERTKHVYIVGGTGNGKSTLLEYAIVQDLQNAKGVAVIDPHGDLVENILRQIPSKRLSDVIYFNPDDTSKPLALNLFEITPDLSPNELIREKETITEAALVVLRKLFSKDDNNGHRIEYILRNTIQTALSVDNPTLFTIYDLLTDYKFRSSVVARLENGQLKNFWLNEVGHAGSFQRVKMLAGITSKIGRFTFSSIATSVLAQPKSSINFEGIIDDAKILICNLSKGIIGEDTSALFGSIIMAKLQMAALKRARQDKESRRDFFLYVDEFQNFASQSFAELLSEARKYHLYITMAEQSTSQQDHDRIVDIILANTGTVITFRTGNPSDERLLLPLFRPYLDSGDIASLDAYNFYARIAGTEASEPVSGQTILMANKGSLTTSTEVKKLSQGRYGRRPLQPKQLKIDASIQTSGRLTKSYPVPQLH